MRISKEDKHLWIDGKKIKISSIESIQSVDRPIGWAYLVVAYIGFLGIKKVKKCSVAYAEQVAEEIEQIERFINEKNSNV